jgi:pantoate--beta-alanine ligase
MKVFESIVQWQQFRAELLTDSLGFVPTMGALHQGHMTLVEASKQKCSQTVVSIFVNPQQFDNSADLEAYPVNLKQDIYQLENAGVDCVLLPDAAQMYPDDYRFKVTEKQFSRQLCGAHRPGHFDGVLTVVMKLLNLVQPDQAFFGEKDWQQLQLIRDMAAAFFMPVEIMACPTKREQDGLAMSSRNQRLTPSDRIKAASLYITIKNSRTADEARKALIGEGFDVDYVEDLEGRRLAAAKLGEIRLIDNVEV